jgi:hypothetical protein
VNLRAISRQRFAVISQLLDRVNIWRVNICPLFAGCNQFNRLLIFVYGMPTAPLQTTLYVPNTDAIVKFGKDFSIGGWSAVLGIH